MTTTVTTVTDLPTENSASPPAPAAPPDAADLRARTLAEAIGLDAAGRALVAESLRDTTDSAAAAARADERAACVEVAAHLAAGWCEQGSIREANACLGVAERLRQRGGQP